MSDRVDVSEVLSAIDNFWRKELRNKYSDLTPKFIDQLRNMEVWFIDKVCIDKSRFLHKVVDLCKERPLLLDFRGMSDESIGKCGIMLRYGT
jgi:hypothetical protein